MRWMDRWAAYEQRRSDQRQARWLERQRERARTGRLTVMDRWAAYEQRKSDRLLAASKELYRLRPLVPNGPVQGPSGSAAVIRVDQAGAWWLRWWRNPVPPGGGGGGGLLGVVLVVCLLITEAIWWLVFHKAYTVHVRTNDHPPIKMTVRLPNEAAAYRAAAQLVSQFQVHGAASLQGQWADAPGST